MPDLQRDLIIDDEFTTLIRPLTNEEYHQLEENILREGCRESLVIWKNIILDGHNRYKICRRWNLPFRTTELELSCREEAMSWICANQLGRRNLSEEMRRYLIGKRYEIEKTILRKENRPLWEPPKRPDGTEITAKELYEAGGTPADYRARMKNPTAERIGSEYHISHGTVQKYARYSRAVDTIAEVSPELAPQVLSGSFKVSQDNLIALSKLDSQNMHRYARQLQSSPDEPYLRYLDTRKRLSGITPQPSRPPAPPTKPRPSQLPIHTGIKNMPEYNPDAEVTGLTLTIPTWGSSIYRIINQTDLRNITPQAKDKLVIALSDLQKAIETLLKAIKGVT